METNHVCNKRRTAGIYSFTSNRFILAFAADRSLCGGSRYSLANPLEPPSSIKSTRLMQTTLASASYLGLGKLTGDSSRGECLLACYHGDTDSRKPTGTCHELSVCGLPIATSTNTYRTSEGGVLPRVSSQAGTSPGW